MPSSNARERPASRPPETTPPPDPLVLAEDYVAAELAVTAAQIALGYFRGLDGKPLTIAEAKERMDRSERYLRWRWALAHE
jgi:hypothetical protein